MANSENILQGHFDSPLSEKGKLQSKNLQEKLNGNYNAIYCSSLCRAMETAEIAIQGKMNINSNIIYLDELREINLGNLQGIKIDEFTEDQKLQWQAIRAGEEFSNHGGENRNQFGSRVIQAFDKIIEENQKKEFSEILVFTHGGVIKAIFQNKFPSIKPKIENTSIFKFKIENDIWSLVS